MPVCTYSAFPFSAGLTDRAASEAKQTTLGRVPFRVQSHFAVVHILLKCIRNLIQDDGITPFIEFTCSFRLLSFKASPRAFFNEISSTEGEAETKWNAAAVSYSRKHTIPLVGRRGR